MIPPDTLRPLTASAVRPGGLRVLVAENDNDTAWSTALLLEMAGHQVYLAGDGASALDAVERVDPDVVLLDVELPGVDGYEVARRLKARNVVKSPLLIAVTGYGLEDDKRGSAEAGIDLHWVKPVDPDRLRRLLKRFERVVADRPG